MLVVEQASAWPPWRAIAYAWFFASGFCFSLYGTDSLNTLTEAVQVIFYISLGLGALVAGVGAIRRMEVVELAGLYLLGGPIVAFIILLFFRGFSNPEPDKFATLGLACYSAGTFTLLYLLGRGLRRLIHAARVTKGKA